MDFRHEDQQRRQHLLTIVDRGNAEQLFSFLQQFHRRPFRSLAEVIAYEGVIDDQIDFIDCTGTRYNVTPLIIAAGKGSYEKTKILLVHGANPNQQCTTGDTALNLAVHRQKYHIADLLLKYHANPNVANQSGKTALHRAVVSYVDENANHIRALLQAGADPTVEDRNQRIPLDEAVITNKPEIVGVLLANDRTLTQRAYRAAIIAARLGHDKCLETLLDYGMDPNITDRSRTTPLHIAVRSLKPSTARLLMAHGADQHIANNRGETPISIAEYLQPDQQHIFLNVLTNTPRLGPSDFRKYTTTTGAAPGISYVHPLLRSHSNWTLDSDEFRSRTDVNSSVQNLLDASNGTYWCCTEPKDAWVIFDLKQQFNISGMRIIGCDNQSTPKSGHIDVSNAFNGPWLKVIDFSCPPAQGNKTDIFFPPLKTRFVRVFISENYGGNDIRIQGVGFYGVDMRLVNLLREHGLERSLQTLLANGVNDLETLDEKRDEILNSSDQYLDVNDHFQLIRLTDSLRRPVLTFLEWFNIPPPTVVAGERLQTFSAAADEGLTDRVRLEEKPENSADIRTVLLRDLEPIQGRSLVDFPDYAIRDPGRYKIRVVSVETPDIRTPWQDIVVAPRPSTVPSPKPSGPQDLPPKTTEPWPDFTSPTGFDKEVTGFTTPFRPSQRFPQTPRPHRHPSGDDSKDDDDDDDDDTDTMQRSRSTHTPKADARKSKGVNESTQSEQRSTRNVGTMHEPVETRNFGNEVQPQSSSTQTSFSLKEKPSKPIMTFIERPDHRRTPVDEFYPDPRTTARTPQPYRDESPYRPFDRTPDASIRRRSPSPPRTSVYRYDPQYRDHSPYRHSSYRSRTPSPQRPPRSATRRRRPPMRSQETDTTLDAMKRQQHAGVQYDPRSTQEKGTTPSLRTKKPPTSYRPLPPTRSLYSPQPYSTSSRYRDQSPRSYQLQPTNKNEYYRHEEEEDEEEEEELPTMHDKSTMAELVVSFDHFTQCDAQPHMADRHIQTTPTIDEDGQRNRFEYPEEIHLRQLPRRTSTSIPQPLVIQPDTLPRPRRSHHSPVRPKRDGLDYTGNLLEVSLHHGHQQRTTPIADSPLLHIGTEHVLPQSSTDEYTVPFATRYVHDSFSSRSRNSSPFVFSALDSTRTRLFPTSPVHQSISNGNFYLTTAPTRSVNSSCRIDISADEY